MIEEQAVEAEFIVGAALVAAPIHKFSVCQAAPWRAAPYGPNLVCWTQLYYKRKAMTKTVKARFANGVLTPLEPLGLDEDKIVLVSVEELPAQEEEKPRKPFRVTPFPGGFAPDFDPANLKDLLCEMDDEEFWRKHNS